MCLAAGEEANSSAKDISGDLLARIDAAEPLPQATASIFFKVIVF